MDQKLWYEFVYQMLRVCGTLSSNCAVIFYGWMICLICELLTYVFRCKSCRVRHVRVQWWRTASRRAWSPPTSSCLTTAANCTIVNSRRTTTAPANHRRLLIRVPTAPRAWSSGTNWLRSLFPWSRKIERVIRPSLTSSYYFTKA